MLPQRGPGGPPLVETALFDGHEQVVLVARESVLQPCGRLFGQLALGYLAVLRKEDGALIGRCGLMDLVVESAAPEHGIRRGWFGREGAPAGIALTFECERSEERRVGKECRL